MYIIALPIFGILDLLSDGLMGQRGPPLALCAGYMDPKPQFITRVHIMKIPSLSLPLSLSSIQLRLKYIYSLFVLTLISSI
jgi:hypothetical protein